MNECVLANCLLAGWLTLGERAHAEQLQVQAGSAVGGGGGQRDVGGVAAERVHVPSDPVEEANLVPDGVIVSGRLRRVASRVCFRMAVVSDVVDDVGVLRFSVGQKS